MQNLSQQKRQRMLDFLEQIKSSSDDEKTVIAINEIENELVEKKYGLIWEKHIEQVDEDIKTNVPVFTEVEDRAILSGVDDSCNFLLEGDNLHSLKLLEKTHAGKIDCIYIDPPYNTGNEDFIYDDSFISADDDYRHSLWLSFMSERLTIARRLLSKRGFIFICIDDKEASQLKLLCDEIFGEQFYEKTDYIQVIHTVRVSATTVTSTDVEYKEVDEEAVIGEGLITEAISVNEGVVMNSAQDDAILLELADAKRKEIQKAYKDLGKRINPLVLIQFPNGEPDKIKAVEEKLAKMQYTRENGMVAAWLSGDKADIPDNLVENDSDLAFLFIKQAINTGWNCKRAKILVKLREHSKETFQIQTIGRIRRMPEGHHYNIPVLDMCYIYTFDKEYQTQLMRGLDKAYIPSRLFLKEQYKDFTLPKELKDEDGDTVDFATVYNQVRNAFVEEFNLTGDRELNKQKFTSKGFKFGEDLYDEIVAGVVTYAKEMLDMKASLDTVTPVSTTEHGFVLRHVINDFKTILGIPYETMRAIMDRLFCFKYKNIVK